MFGQKYMIANLSFSSGYSLIYSVTCTVFNFKRSSGSVDRLACVGQWLEFACGGSPAFLLDAGARLPLLLDLSKYNLHRKISISAGSVF